MDSLISARVPKLANSRQAATLLFDAAMSVPASSTAAVGRVGWFSARSPGKETPNEDAAAVIPVGEHALVLAVADGLGGSAAGEEASRVALQSLQTVIQEGLAQATVNTSPVNADLPTSATEEAPDESAASNVSNAWLRTAILDGLELANRKILALGSGAATTIAVVVVTRDEPKPQDRVPTFSIRPYHVGDSMILLVGGRGMIKIETIPHSPVGYGLESGLLNHDEAMHHEDRHIVSNVVGSPNMRIEIGPSRTLAPRDTLLLASDGLADNLHMDEIVQHIRKGPMKQAMSVLTGEATTRMNNPVEGRPSKPDDLTFVMFRPPRRSRKRPRAENTPSDSKSEKF